MSTWSVGEVVAVLTFALAMIGGMVHVVWLLSGIKMRLDIMVAEHVKIVSVADETKNQLNEHKLICAHDKGHIEQRLDSYDKRITRLEAS